MIKPPAFWQAARPTVAARLLAPLGSLYGWLTTRRMARDGAKAGLPVICVGNLTLGGAGKTPTALFIAGRLEALGARPAFLSRGYGGRVTEPLLVDPRRHGAELVGDEPLLLAARAPTVVSPDRVAGARLARQHGADILVMDDGLQNPALAKDLTLAVIDGGAGFGNGLIFPAGPLRAGVRAQRPFIDAVVLIGPGDAGEAAAAALNRRPVIAADLVLDEAVAAQLQGARVLALAGIGRPEKFHATLRQAGAAIVETLSVADHAPYALSQLTALAQQAARADLLVVTTEKDRARMGDLLPPALSERLVVAPVRLMPREGAAAMDGLLSPLLARRPAS
jgi:tetraacyldisaccharide 4'-kinase